MILWLTTLAMFAASVPLTVANIPSIGRLLFPDDFLTIILGLVNSSLGFLIVRFQPRQKIGWLFMALAIPAAISNLAQSYAIYGLLAAPEAGLPGLVLTAWLQKWFLYAGFPIPFAMLFMLLPNGRLPSRRWRWIFGLALVGLTLQVIQQMIEPGPIRVYFANVGRTLPVTNPTGIQSFASLLRVFEYLWLFGLAIILAGVVSLLARYRTAAGGERQQLKWLMYFIILFFILLPFSFRQNDSILGDIALILLILMLPAGTAIAILRYNLYGIDVIIRRTIQYTLLTGILAAVYFGLVLILQTLFSGLTETQSPLVLVISTLTIAALFNPLRLRILAIIDRRFFRSRYDAERVLFDFGAAMRSEVDFDYISAALLEVVLTTVRPQNASLWMNPVNLRHRTVIAPTQRRIPSP